MNKIPVRLFIESIKLVWKSSAGWTLASILISILRSIFPLLLLWQLKIVVDSITRAADTVTESSIILPVVTLAVIWFLDEVSSALSNYTGKKQAMKLEVYMYALLHSKSIKLDLINFEKAEYFDCLSRAAREATWRPNNIMHNLVSILRGFLSILLISGLIITLNWTLAVLLLVANIPGIWLRIYYAELLYNFKREQTPEARKSAYFNWLLTGDRPSRELRLFGLGKYFMDLFQKSFLRQKEEELSILKRKTSVELVSIFFKAAAFLATLLYIAHQTINRNLTTGQMAMFLLAFRQGMVYIKDLFSSLAGLYEDSLFIGDTFEFLNLKENVLASEPVSAVSPLKEKIVVENLEFTYPGNKFPSINKISFEIKKGEIVALVGPNGAGKSTLVRLLCRLYDADSGNIKYDLINIKNIHPEEYRKQFSVVFQDFMLYNLSAGENIRLGNLDEKDTESKLVECAKTIGADRLIKELPYGYDTMIGNLFDDSRELSWGEWQKIALARALYREVPVLILDEPSSSLDADTEYDIFSRFRDIVKGRTSVIISHRFTNVSLADRIIVLDKGSIVETGTHNELIALKGMYHRMYTKQSSRYIE